MTPQPDDSAARTLRATSSVVSFIVAAAFVAFLFGDAAVRGDWLIVARWLPVALLILWGLWLVLVRSSIRIERERLVVRNLARVHELPWSRVAAALDGPQLIVELHDGARIACWGGPFPARPGARSRGVVSDAVVLMEGARESAPESDAPVRRSWDRVALISGAVLAVAVIASLLGTGVL